MSAIVRIKEAFSFDRLGPNVASGLVVGLMNVLMQVSFAALIFSGPLSDFVSRGIGLAFHFKAVYFPGRWYHGRGLKSYSERAVVMACGK